VIVCGARWIKSFPIETGGDIMAVSPMHYVKKIFEINVGAGCLVPTPCQFYTDLTPSVTHILLTRLACFATSFFPFARVFSLSSIFPDRRLLSVL
jgi:hypothetical protein